MSSIPIKAKYKNDGDLTNLVGKVRKWHLIILCVISINSVFNAFGQLAMAFMLPDIPYSCSRTEIAKRLGWSQEQWTELTQEGTPTNNRHGYCVRRNVTFINSTRINRMTEDTGQWNIAQTDLPDNSTANFTVGTDADLNDNSTGTTIVATTIFDNVTNETVVPQTTASNLTNETSTEAKSAAAVPTESVMQWRLQIGSVIPCTSWEFDHSVHRSTILEQWTLVCERDNLRPIPQALSMAGLIVGNVFFSHFSDRFGRRVAVYTGTVLCAVSGVIAMTTSNFFVFIIARFFSSVSKIGIQASIVIFLETSESSSRWMFSILNGIGFHLGMGALAVIAYYSPSWRYLQGLISAPAILLLPFLYFVWESPRWLLSKNRIDKGVEILTRIAHMNGVTKAQITEDMPAIRERYDAMAMPTSKSAADLFRTTLSGGNMARVTGILWYLCFTSGLLFYSAVFLSTSLGSQPHTSFCIPILGEVCAIVLVALGVRYMRRRLIVFTIATLSASGFLALALTTYIDLGNVRSYIEMSAVVLVRSSTAAFTQLYPVYGAELYSTPLRNVGISFCDLMYRLASTIDPFGRYWLPRIDPRLLPFLYATMSFMAAGLALLLPETLNQELDDGILTKITSKIGNITNSARRRASVFPQTNANNNGMISPTSGRSSRLPSSGAMTPAVAWTSRA